ncbi:MAG: DUF4350 domain-containing protein [Myxococcota bacterium]
MSGWWLPLVLLGVGTPGVLDEAGGYRFCHEPQYPLYRDERRWCDLIDDPHPSCPDLPAACAAEIDPAVDGGGFGYGSSGADGDGKGRKRAAPATGDGRKARRERMKFEIPRGLSTVAQVVLIAIVVAGLGLLVRHLLRRRFDDPADEEDASSTTEAAAPAPAAEAARQRAKETDVTRLLALARQEAAAGRFESAVELAYAAALRRLDGDGLIELHPSRTNGDYVRRLRGHAPTLAPALRDVAREVEGIQFGAHAATSSRFESILRGVLGITGRTATVALLLLSSLHLTGCGSSSAGPPEARPMLTGGDTSPSGTKAVLEAIASTGVSVAYRIETLTTVGEDVGTLIVLPDAGPEDGDWAPILEWVEAGGRLILAGERARHPDLELYEDPREATTTQLFNGMFLGFEDLEGWSIEVPPSGGLLPQIGIEDAEPSLYRYYRDAADSEDVSVYAVALYRGGGEIIAFANEDLFTNIAMTVDDNARAVAAIARPFDGEHSVQICTAWMTGRGSSSPLEAIRNADLTPLIVQLLVFVVLLVLYRGIAFGRLREPPGRSRRAFVDHIRALGTQYARADASGHAWRAYATWALEQIDARLPGERRRGLQATAAAIAARTHWPESDIIPLLVDANDAAERYGAPPSVRGPVGSAPTALEKLQRMAAMLEALGLSSRGASTTTTRATPRSGK